MVNKKNILIAILATFCLTSTVFMVLPIRSAYDPWADLNEDGKIDMKDIAATAKLFGTAGDPTKNVTINHNGYSWSAETVIDYVYNTSRNFTILTAGFAEMTVWARSTAVNVSVRIFKSNAMNPDYSTWTLPDLALMQPNRTETVTCPLEGAASVVIVVGWFGMPSALSARVDLNVAISTSVSQETMKRAWYSETMQIGGDNFATFSFPTEGYDRISLYLSAYNNATVNVYFTVGQGEVKMDTIILNTANPTAERVYQVIGDELAVTSGALVTVNVYATA